MQLDVPTLFVMLIVVTAVVAALLLWAWLQNRRIQALAWWAAAYLEGALGSAIAPFRGLIPDWLTIDLSNALLILAYGLIWTGARVFGGRSGQWTCVLGAVIWLSACQFDAFHSSLPARASLISLLAAAYVLLAAWEIWRGAAALPSRMPTVLCLTAHGLVFLARIPAMLWSPATESTRPFAGYWFTFIAFEGVVFSVAAAFLLLAMAKEQVELYHKTASRTDPLTGAFNRRAFTGVAERILARASRDGSKTSLLVFDLDHFKRINDTFGHPVGDEVLKLFCRIATTHLRPTDVFGRLGGEEFAALLAEADATVAHQTAERITTAFAQAGQAIAFAGLEATVSTGIAVSADGTTSFADLLAAADRGLYRAKRAGRNRAEEEPVALLSSREAVEGRPKELQRQPKRLPFEFARRAV